MTDSEAQTAKRRRPSDLSSHSSADSSADEAGRPIQWLATAREKRSTAGNRMKAMLANEEPDSDLELLFAEDDDDAGFTDVGEDASDVHMDSSSSDEEDGPGDGAEGAAGLEGEKELEQQAKERRAAQRKKRKGQDAIPARFRKKVRIDPATTTTATSSASTTPRPAAPPPPSRPKKKSERASWLPSAADQPTRASLRQTTRLSKEQLHAQMEEREARRLKQMAQMQKKAERLEAIKKPPMTQEERLREAETVERRNAKSLNRWEVAEKQREEERLAKLAALNQRTLKGPVITFWSGTREWKDGGAARYVVLEEKPKRKPREKKDKGKEKDKDKAGDAGTPQDTTVNDLSEPVVTGQEAKVESVETPTPPPPTPAQTQSNQDHVERTVKTEAPQELSVPKQPAMAIPPSHNPPSLAAPTPPPLPLPPPPSGLAAPAPAPLSNSSDSRPANSKPSGILAAPAPAPPAGIAPSPNEDVASSSRHSPAGNVLAAPSPQPPQPQPQPQPQSTLAESQQPQPAISKDLEQLRDSLLAANSTPSDVPPPTEDSTYTRNAIVYQNFDENLIKDKVTQTQILFGRKMNKLSKPPPSPICVITNHPAKYRDPKTGLPFYNSYAYRQIQRLCKGDYHWSKLLGAWVGAGQFAAKGVPERFLNPDAPPPSPPLAKTPKAEGGDGKVTTEAGEKKDAETEDAKKESSVPAGGSIGATNLPTTASKDAAASGPTSNTPPNPISTATNESKVEKVEKVETAQAQGSLTT